MKTFNTKLIVALFTTLVLTGCMPDSLTKFKKDAPKKAASTAVGDTSPPITDGSGNAVDPDTLVFPTKFYFGQEGVSVEEAFPVNVPVGSFVVPKTDGTIADPAKRSIIFIRCELDQNGPVITRTLPPGLALDSNTCAIAGTPTAVYSDAGAKINYTVRMLYKGAAYTGVGTESSLSASLKLSVSAVPAGLEMTQNDKLQIKLSTKGGALVSNIQANTDSLVNYNRYGLLNTSKNVAGIVKYVDSVSSTVGVYKVQPLVVASTIPFSVNGFVSSASKSGKILSKNSTTNTIYVESLTSSTFVAGEALDNVQTYVTTKTTVAQPLLVGSTAPFTINGYVSSSGKSGKVSSISTTTNTIYVELLSGSAFAAGNALDNVQTYAASKTTVSSVISVNAANATYKFSVGAKVDNDSQYFTEKFNVDKVIQTYERGVAIQPISPILTSTIFPANSIEYSISPVLPAGLSFSTSTGIISGTFTDTLDATEFTITAYNDLGESVSTINLAAINSPKDLSYTLNQLITVNSNALFTEGDNIFQPLAPPLTESIFGKVFRKVSTNKLSIEAINGEFLSEAKLDFGNKYYAQKGYVVLNSDPGYYNVALTVSAPGSFTVPGYISTAPYCTDPSFLTKATCEAATFVWHSGAKGRVIAKDGSVLYIQFLTPDSVITTFSQGSPIDNVYPFSSSKGTISQVEASNMSFGLTDATGFTAGHDFSTSSAIGLSGYVHELDAVNGVIYVNEINRTNPTVGSAYFQSGHTIVNNEDYTIFPGGGSTQTTLTGVAHDNLIIVERGVPRVIKANISQGTSLIYSVSPSLPTGLTLNTTTGTISGTPATMSPRQSYVVSAKNLLDKNSYAFDLEVRDYFAFAETTGAKSFITHKIGTNMSSRGCKINSADILANNGSALDIGCDLEAEELELFYTKLKMSASVGAGTCEYISFKPYSFWQFAPEKTSRAIDYDSGCASGVADAINYAPTSADFCYGNYINEGGPNCDEGSVTVTVHTRTAAAGACDTVATQVIQCGGVKTACLAGPVTKVMTPAELMQNYRSKTIASSTGLTNTWDLDSPLQFLDVTNTRVANGVNNNLCTQSKLHRNIWANQQPVSELQSPFAKESPFYEFTCLDAAKDIKARIRLTVREWNRTFKVNDVLNLVAGIPVNMNVATPDSFGVSYNNVNDWDDDYSLKGAAVPTQCAVTPGAPLVSEGPFKPAVLCTATPSGVDDPDYIGFLTPTTCEKNGGTWVTKNFRFPGADI